MTEVTSSSYTFSVEHKKISSPKPFEETVAALEAQVPHIDDGIWRRLAMGEAAAVRREIEAGSSMLIFVKRDHGMANEMIDRRRKILQFEIGNPVTASKMTSKVAAAGIYAPLRIVLYEDASGGSTFEYDLPSAQFGQFDNADVLEVGRMLDGEIEKALMKAAS